MPKLGDLKALLDAQRARDEATQPPEAKPPARHAQRAPAHGHREPQTPVSPKRAIGATKHAEGDVDLAQAFADVKRLPPVNRAKIPRSPPPPIPRQRIADEEEALLASKYGTEIATHSWDAGQEHEGEQTFVRPGIGSDVLAKLRRGHWSLQGELDLHGLTSEEARDRLADFLLDARARGARCVRVIHGKGLTSPRKEPVLKGKVRRWLAHWDDVLAYSEAPRHAGGGGAVLILLKGT
jgi:DNA-nicking Smr family endonuclease